MGQYIQDMFTVAMGGGTIRRFGEMAVVTLPDAPLVTSSDALQKAQRWARSRNTSGHEAEDRVQLLAQLETLIAHTDSSSVTRGDPPLLTKLVKRMREEGMDLQVWRIPQPVLDALEAEASAEFDR